MARFTCDVSQVVDPGRYVKLPDGLQNEIGDCVVSRISIEESENPDIEYDVYFRWEGSLFSLTIRRDDLGF